VMARCSNMAMEKLEDAWHAAGLDGDDHSGCWRGDLVHWRVVSEFDGRWLTSFASFWGMKLARHVGLARGAWLLGNGVVVGHTLELHLGLLLAMFLLTFVDTSFSPWLLVLDEVGGVCCRGESKFSGGGSWV